ncbi:MAG: DUF362 domain-containing protein [Candidatus Aminicenantales bacterium]
MKSEVFFIEAKAEEGPEVISRKAQHAFLRLGFHDLLEKEDFVALKIHFGEKNNTGYIQPAWLRGIIGEIRKKTPRAYLTDSNTLYVGYRSNSVDHIRLAWSHGFTPDVVDIPVIIADGLIGRDKHESLGTHGRIEAAKISSAFLNTDAFLGLTHVTGHVQTGIGAALKNLGMGCASRAGKLDQHSVAHPRVTAKACRNCGLCFDYCSAGAIIQAEGHVLIDDKKCIGCGECLVVCKFGAIKLRWDEDFQRIQEKIAEYAFYVRRIFREKIGFLNFLIKITKDCDCMAQDQARIVEDIGILASKDPVAIDKASADLVLGRSGGRDVFRAGYDIDWSGQLRHGVKIGLGSMDYKLIELS